MIEDSATRLNETVAWRTFGTDYEKSVMTAIRDVMPGKIIVAIVNQAIIYSFIQRNFIIYSFYNDKANVLTDVAHVGCLFHLSRAVYRKEFFFQ